jgi:hypothetical protein
LCFWSRLASTMEVLVGFPGYKEFIKSFREGAKVLIIWRDRDKDGQYVEVMVYGVGGQRGILLKGK